MTIAFILIAIGNLRLITHLQQWAPGQLLGRLTGVLMLASVGMMPISTLICRTRDPPHRPRLYFPLDAATVAIAALAQLTSRTWRQVEPKGPADTSNSLASQTAATRSV